MPVESLNFRWRKKSSLRYSNAQRKDLRRSTRANEFSVWGLTALPHVPPLPIPKEGVVLKEYIIVIIHALHRFSTLRLKQNWIVCHVPLFSIPSGTEWQQGDNRDKDLVTMMQIDCQVMDTKFVNIKKSSIPVPSSDSPYFSTPASVSVPQDYSAPAGNTFVKPAK